MQLQTILNRVEKYKSFVYGSVRWAPQEKRLTLEVEIRERKNSRAICSECGRKGPQYDRLPERRYEFVPLWGIVLFFVYAPRRVDCRRCGVKVERVPWCEGKQRLTTSYRWFLARWAKRLSGSDVAAVFHTTWDNVFRSVKYAVQWGLARRELRGIKSIGVDEIQWPRGHHYLTLVYQIDEGLKRLLWIGKERTEESLSGFFELLGKRRSRAIKFVCTDMWKAYIKVIAKHAPRAVHVLDRFHVMQKFGKALDEIRAGEARQLKADGYEPILKHSRWCLLKRPENLTEKQGIKLEELLRYNLKSVRGYLLRADFQEFWECRDAPSANEFLSEWSARTMRSRLEPLKKVARTLRRHRALLLNWFRANGAISAGVVEGLNNKVKLTMRKSYGFRTPEAIETALFHTLGKLPEPEFTHEFC